MSYWTLLALRMMARAGLFAAVSLWLFGQWTIVQFSMRPGWHAFYLYSGKAELVIDLTAPYLRRVVPLYIDGRLDVCPGFSLFGSSSGLVLQLDHWFLCLTFLIATVLTSVRWRMPTAEQEQELANE